MQAGREIELKRPKSCPACGNETLIFWGKRERYATGGKQNFHLYVRRVRCKNCLSTHTILPAFLLRGKVYLAERIVRALELVYDGGGVRSAASKLKVARSTVSRWALQFKSQAEAIYGRFLYLYHTHFPGAPPPAPYACYCRSALSLARRLFILASEKELSACEFSRWLVLATRGLSPANQPWSLRGGRIPC